MAHPRSASRGLLIAAAVATGLGALGIRPHVARSEDAAGVSLRTEYYTLSAPSGLEADAKAMREALDQGITALKQQFAPIDAAALLTKASVTIQLYEQPTDQASVGTATTESGTRDGSAGTYYARIHLLAPSRYPADTTTSAGEPKDLAYCKRLIVHEYSTVLLDLLTRNKARGWLFFSAPDWFVQGYEEYIGMTCADEQAGKATLGKYVALVKTHPEWVSTDFGLHVTQPYIAGAVLLHFMHEHYGGDRVRAILTSQEASFGGAVRATLKVGVERFVADWTSWLANQASAASVR